MGVASLGVKGGDWQEKSGGDGSTSYSLPQKGVSHGAEAESSQSLQGKKKFRGWGVRGRRKEKGVLHTREWNGVLSHVPIPRWEPMPVGMRLAIPAIKMLKSFHTRKKPWPWDLQVPPNCPGLPQKSASPTEKQPPASQLESWPIAVLIHWYPQHAFTSHPKSELTWFRKGPCTISHPWQATSLGGGKEGHKIMERTKGM